MIEDFIDELTATLQKRLEARISDLIAATSDTRHDLIRGQVIALNEAIRDIADLQKSFLKEAA
jgi:hypothetical protein